MNQDGDSPIRMQVRQLGRPDPAPAAKPPGSPQLAGGQQFDQLAANGLLARLLSDPEKIKTIDPQVMDMVMQLLGLLHDLELESVATRYALYKRGLLLPQEVQAAKPVLAIRVNQERAKAVGQLERRFATRPVAPSESAGPES